MGLFAASSGAGAADEAATLTEVNGSVFINQGRHYQPGVPGMKLPANTLVITKEKAGALVTSKRGCATRLGANSIFTVKQADPCHGGGKPMRPAAAEPPGVGGAAGADGGGLDWFTGTTNGRVALGAGAVAAVTGGVMGGLAASGGLDPDSSGTFDNLEIAGVANAVIAAGGTPAQAFAAIQAATATIANGGDAQAAANAAYQAVLAAGGPLAAAQAAGFTVMAGIIDKVLTDETKRWLCKIFPNIAPKYISPGSPNQGTAGTCTGGRG